MGDAEREEGRMKSRYSTGQENRESRNEKREISVS